MRAKTWAIAALVAASAIGIFTAVSGGPPQATATAAATATPAASPTPAATPTPAASPTFAASPTPAVAICRLNGGLQTIAGRTAFVDLASRFPAPVVVDFHGGGQSAGQEHGYTGLGRMGASRGFVVVTPNGTGGRWNFPGTEPLPDDAAFTAAIASTLKVAGCSDGKLYTAGISDGADMAVAAGCRLAVVRAVFVAAPSITPRGSCTRKSFAEIHGTADPVVPYAGSAAGTFPDTPSESVVSRLAFWTAGCSGPLTGVQPAPGTTVETWGCPGGRAVQLYTVTGGGHTWPGAAGPEPVAGLGRRAGWSADSAALDFFSTH